MDTRNKIVTASHAAKEPCALVRGYFDPLCVAHVRRLEEIANAGGGPVTILLDSPPRPLLPVAARAELLAALHVVKHVVIAVGVRPVEFQGAAIMDETHGDLLRIQDLMEHVKRRQNAG
jgi:bifunctional ADP-heptose synthase (sugar kinase/adenylyltransferase)